MKLLIKNGRVIDPASATNELRDIIIDKNKISSVEKKYSLSEEGFKIINAQGCIVAPGFIDKPSFTIIVNCHHVDHKFSLFVEITSLYKYS